MDEDSFKDEKILWRDKPVRLPFIVSAILRQILFGLVFSGFAIFWMALVAFTEGPWFIGLPFFLIGIGLVIGSPVGRFMAYKNTKYSITDRRLIIKTGARMPHTSYLTLSNVYETKVEAGFFDRMFRTGSVYALSTSGVVSVLENIMNPNDVHGLLQAAIRETVVVCDGCGVVLPAGATVCPSCGKMTSKKGLANS